MSNLRSCAGRFRVVGRLLIAALCVGASSVDPAPSAAAEGESTSQPATEASLGYVGVNPGTVREIDVRTGRVLEPLPFDVQFFIQSEVDTNVISVSGRYLQARKLLAGGLSCNDLFPTRRWEARGYLAPLLMVQNAAGNRIAMARSSGNDRPVARPEDPVGPAARGKRRNRAPAVREISFIRFIDETAVENAGTETESKKLTRRSVELSVPALAPNRDVCFQFDLERKVDQEAFRARARRAIETELQDARWVRQVPVAGSTTGETKRSTIQTPVAFNRLRRRLLGDILQQRKRGERLRAPRGSFFDPHVNLSGVTGAHTQRFVEIMAWQTDRFDMLAGIGGTTSEPGSREQLVVALRTLLTSDAYQALQQNGTLTKRLLGNEIIPGLSDANYGQWADGRRDGAGDAASLDLEDVWQPAALEKSTNAAGVTTPGVLDNLEQGQRDFAALARVLKRFEENPDLARMDGLQDGRREQLAKDVQKVREKLFFHIDWLRKLHAKLEQRQEAIDRLVDQLALELETQVALLGTTVGDYETRASFYISADVGVGFAPDVEEMFTYFGTNIYFRPVNKKAPLQGLSFKKRFSIMLGLTNESLESEGQLKGIVGTSPLLVAGGFRLNDFIRLSAGTVIFKDEDPNPLITEESLAWSPYVSISIDWNLRKILARFGGALNLTDPPAAAD